MPCTNISLHGWDIQRRTAQGIVAVPLCLCMCVCACASCRQVMKQPRSRIVFVLTEESLQSPHYSHVVNKDRAHCISQTGSPRYLEWWNKYGSQQLIEDAVHVCRCSVGNTASQWWIHWSKLWAESKFSNYCSIIVTTYIIFFFTLNIIILVL